MQCVRQYTAIRDRAVGTSADLTLVHARCDLQTSCMCGRLVWLARSSSIQGCSTGQ